MLVHVESCSFRSSAIHVNVVVVDRSSPLTSGDNDDRALTAAVSGFVGRTLLANADALCAPASPLIPVEHVPM